MKNLIYFILLSILVSCGMLNKEKLKLKSSANKQTLETEAVRQYLRSDFSAWQHFLLQDASYSTAFIHSDSTISYRPDSGFRLSNGILFLTKATQQQIRSEENLFANEEQELTIEQGSSQSQDAQESIVHSEKERHPPGYLIYIGIILILIFMLLKRFVPRWSKSGP